MTNALVAAVLLTLTCGAALAAEPDAGGGRVVQAATEGSMYVNQALVHYVRPRRQRKPLPVIMVPGHNLSSSIYLGTPDGREGWAQMFARAGYDVYVINDPSFDFSRGFNVEPFGVPEEGGPPADPDAEQAWARDVWRRWGFGTSEGNPYPETRFPTDQFDVFKANYPFVSNAGRSYSAAIVALLDLVGPAILMAHSAGGPRALSAAKARPDLVAGFVLVEPTGPPTETDFPAFAGTFMLGVYGDYIDSRNQGARKAATEDAAVLFTAHGGVGDVVSLPDDLAVYGNTHIMMQDNNNAFIAELIMDWLAENTETRKRPRRQGRGKGNVGPGGKGRGKGNPGSGGDGRGKGEIGAGKHATPPAEVYFGRN